MEEKRSAGMGNKRPLIITVVCIIHFLGVASAILFYTYKFLTVPDILAFLVITFVPIAIMLFGLIGMWVLRKWGVILYGLGASLNFFMVLYQNRPLEAYHFIAPIFTLAVGLFYFKRMS